MGKGVLRHEPVEAKRTRGRAAALVGRGLTPSRLRDHLTFREPAEKIAGLYGVTADDVRFLTARWPMAGYSRMARHDKRESG